MGRTSKKNELEGVIFLGRGSYAYTKLHKQHTGLHWTIDDNKYWFMSVKPSSVNEMCFDTYNDLVKYCKDKYPDSTLMT